MNTVIFSNILYDPVGALDLLVLLYYGFWYVLNDPVCALVLHEFRLLDLLCGRWSSVTLVEVSSVVTDNVSCFQDWYLQQNGSRQG